MMAICFDGNLNEMWQMSEIGSSSRITERDLKKIVCFEIWAEKGKEL